MTQTQDLIVTPNKAYELDQKVDESRKLIGQNFILLGGLLKEIWDGNYSEFLMDDFPGHFDRYLASKRFGRSAAYSWIKIHETFVEKYSVEPERLEEAGWGALDLILPVVNDSNYDRLLEKAETLSISDLKTELRGEKLAERASQKSNQLDEKANPNIILGNATEQMTKFKDGEFDCIITSYPPDDSSWIDEARRLLKPDGSLFVFLNTDNMFYQGNQLQEFQFKIIRDIVWTHKPINTASGLTRSHQTVVWASKGSRPICNLVEPEKDVWEIQDVARHNHPTDKPEALIEKIIEMATLPKEKILDPFCGAGTVLVVGERMGRQVVGIESEDDWHEYTTNRLL